MTASTKGFDVTVADPTIFAARRDLPRFRSLLRAWLERTVPPHWRAGQMNAAEQDQVEFQRWWFRQLSAIGMHTAHWPPQWGGDALGIEAQIIFHEELARAQAPNTTVFVVSLNQVPATLFAAGTQSQRDRYIAGVHAGDIWCQGFSEPGAGSDLAQLRTRAVKSGNEYVVDGQKVWTSFGRFAKYCLLLARTDPSAPVHRGISLFVLKMNSPGVSVRPIRQITENAEFNEVFLDQVRIPAENLVGKEGEGWSIARMALSAERGLIIFEQCERLRCFAERLWESAAASTWLRDDQYRREFIAAYTDVQAALLMIRKMLVDTRQTGELSDLATPLYVKLFYAELLQRFTELLVRLNGLEGQTMVLDVINGGVPNGNWMLDYVNSWTWTISGGTNEIIRNLIAERVLGLPR